MASFQDPAVVAREFIASFGEHRERIDVADVAALIDRVLQEDRRARAAAAVTTRDHTASPKGFMHSGAEPHIDQCETCGRLIVRDDIRAGWVHESDRMIK